MDGHADDRRFCDALRGWRRRPEIRNAHTEEGSTPDGHRQLPQLARRAGGVNGGGAAERSEGTVDADEHRAFIERRWPAADSVSAWAELTNS